MNETLLIEALNNSSNKQSEITQQISFVIQQIVEVSTTTWNQHGAWKFLIVLFAIIGFFAILSAILSKLFDGFGTIFKIFIVIPAIIIIGFINKKKRKERLTAWGEFKKDLKKTNTKVSKKMWALWIFSRIVFPLLIFIYILSLWF